MFRKLLSIEEAKRTLRRHYSPKPVGLEEASLNAAYGRVTAEDIVSEINVPSFDRSTVDGYAVVASDTFGAEEDKPVSLKVVGKVGVGEMPRMVVEYATAVEISTGAPIPKGADAVVMLEYAVRKDNSVQIYRSVAPSENILPAGFDVKAGETILKRGQLLRPRDLGVLAAVGLSSVKVYKKPKIAIISTGNEIVKPGTLLPSGKIYDINSTTLTASVIKNGGEPIFLGITTDAPEEIRGAVKRGLETADVILTSGATSVGPEDVVPTILNDLGKPGVLVHGLSVKPGKPTTIAVIEGKPVFALPGHPTSALMVFSLLVRPIIHKLAGLSKEPRESTIEARATGKIFPAKGRLTFIPVKIERELSGGVLAHPIPPESGAITTLAKADGFVEIPIGKQFVNAGEKVSVHLLEFT